VDVRDDGPGIDGGLAYRMFLPRERGRTDGQGAGLGLAIARGIVDAHGGTIAVAPYASGAHIVVTLAVDPSPEDAAALDSV